VLLSHITFLLSILRDENRFKVTDSSCVPSKVGSVDFEIDFIFELINLENIHKNQYHYL
jgi:hypothetical protein